jgi:hypothetical protein
MGTMFINIFFKKNTTLSRKNSFIRPYFWKMKILCVKRAKKSPKRFALFSKFAVAHEYLREKFEFFLKPTWGLPPG